MVGWNDCHSPSPEHFPHFCPTHTGFLVACICRFLAILAESRGSGQAAIIWSPSQLKHIFLGFASFVVLALAAFCTPTTPENVWKMTYSKMFQASTTNICWKHFYAEAKFFKLKNNYGPSFLSLDFTVKIVLKTPRHLHNDTLEKRMKLFFVSFCNIQINNLAKISIINSNC